MSEVGLDVEVFKREELIQFLMKRYVKKYDVTLSPTPENIRDALHVYSIGWNEGLGIRQAVEEVYGYRYRRMENFIRELDLWGIVREGWLAPIIILKVYSSYASKETYRCDIFRIDCELEVPVPIVPSYITEDFLDQVLAEAVQITEMIYLATPLLLEHVRIAYDFKDRYVYLYTKVSRSTDLKAIIYKYRARDCREAARAEPRKIAEEETTIVFKPRDAVKTYVHMWERK